MKTDRLLSIIIYLMNHELVSASVLAERFGVSVRTFQRDMESIDAAGVPVISIQGPHGGFGIMDTFKMDNRLVSVEDLYYIITSLKSISDTIEDTKIGDTLEKMKGLIPKQDAGLLEEKNSRLSIDFSMLGGDPSQQSAFKVVKEAVDTNRLLEFTYTNNKLERQRRVIEPMTLAFKWRSWYLYGYCRNREDYRLFRISKIRDAVILPQRFRRRERSYEEFQGEQNQIPMTELTLQFDPIMHPIVEEYYPEEDREPGPDGTLIVTARMPEDGWMYGFILSYGEFITVLDPPHVKEEIKRIAGAISKKYP